MSASRVGIYRHGAGWRAVVSQGRDRPLIQRQFPIDTDFATMQTWRADEHARLHLTRKTRATMGSFKADARKYLTLVTALPTYKEREREIALWVDIFGTQQRHAITSADIRGIRDTWLTEPRAEKKPPLAPGTVNKRLRALSNLWHVLDPHAPNPARDVPEAKEPAPEPRSLDYQTVAAILAALPEQGRANKGEKRPKVSYSRLRLFCMAYCPITPKQLGQLAPADLDLARGILRVPARSKGRGAKAIWQKLLPPALEAFRAFDAAHAYGPFSASSLRKAMKSAAARAGITIKVWPYRLRHSFGTMAYRATGSLEAVGKLMQHRQKSTTARYAMAAEQDVMDAAVDQIADWHNRLAKHPRKKAQKTAHSRTSRPRQNGRRHRKRAGNRPVNR